LTAILMREARGERTVLLVATGVMTTRALEAAEMLARDGIAASLLHIHHG
jgi:transketolase